MLTHSRSRCWKPLTRRPTLTALAIHPPGSAAPSWRQLFHHAWPILIAQLLSMAMMIADTLIAGRYGTLDLAGVAIGSSFYISVVMLLGGILQAVGAHRGPSRRRRP